MDLSRDSEVKRAGFARAEECGERSPVGLQSNGSVCWRPLQTCLTHVLGARCGMKNMAVTKSCGRCSHFCKELSSNVSEILGSLQLTGESRINTACGCVLCASPPPGLVWPKYDATLNSTFHPRPIIPAVPFSDCCWPVSFPLDKCNFSEVDCKHSSSPVLHLN